MSARQVIALVFRREVGDRLHNKAFLITTAISVVVIVGIVVGPSLFGDDGPASYDVGISEQADLPPDFAPILSAIVEADDATVEVEGVPDRASAEDAVRDGDLDAVVVDTTTVLAEDLDPTLGRAIEQALASSTLNAALADAGISPERAADLLATELVVVTPDGDDDDTREAGFGLGLAVTVLLFLTLQINGASILTTTVEEKSSRVVEVLLSTVRPWQLLAGKLVAMTVLSVAQLVLYAGAALVAIRVVGDLTLPPGSPLAVVSSIVMFVLGFGLWASVYAVAGSLASSAEDAQSAAGPIGFVAAAVYFAVVIGVVPNPDGVLARVLTFIPFSAPFAVPARAASGLPIWEFVLAAVVTGLGTWLGVRLAGRLYSAAVLSGGRMTWRDAFRAEPIR